MLNGIGGRTIAEAKRNLTWVEVQRWEKYLAKRGGINVAERLEYVMAQVSSLIANKQTFVDAKGHIHGAMKKKDGSRLEPRDFMPHADPVVDEPEELTVEKIMSVLKPGKK